MLSSSYADDVTLIAISLAEAVFLVRGYYPWLVPIAGHQDPRREGTDMDQRGLPDSGGDLAVWGQASHA